MTEKRETVVTIKDVAERAGVSVATAGRALGNYGRISEETRERILQVAKEINYVPNKLAQGMRSRSTNTIGVVVPDIQNNFFGGVLASMEKKARAKGYSLLICNTNENQEIEKECLNMLDSKQVDGILLASTFVNKDEIPPKFLRTTFRNIPMVLFDRSIEGLKTTSILTDNYLMAYKTTKYLIGLGHTDIVTIGSGKNGFKSNTVKQREAGYEAALRETGIMNGGISIDVDWQNPVEMEKKINILLDYHKVSAVIILNNSLFGGFLRILNTRKLRFPQDLSVIVWDDEAYDEFLNITAVRQPLAKMGELAVDNLIEQIESDHIVNEAMTITLNGQLIKRTSCKIKINS